MRHTWKWRFEQSEGPQGNWRIPSVCPQLGPSDRSPIETCQVANKCQLGGYLCRLTTSLVPRPTLACGEGVVAWGNPAFGGDLGAAQPLLQSVTRRGVM